MNDATAMRPFRTYIRTYRLVIRVPGCKAGRWYAWVKLLTNVTEQPFGYTAWHLIKKNTILWTWIDLGIHSLNKRRIKQMKQEFLNHKSHKMFLPYQRTKSVFQTIATRTCALSPVLPITKYGWCTHLQGPICICELNLLNKIEHWTGRQDKQKSHSELVHSDYNWLKKAFCRP